MKTLALIAFALTAIACSPETAVTQPTPDPVVASPVFVAAPPARKPPMIACTVGGTACDSVWSGNGLTAELAQPDGGSIYINMAAKLQPNEFPSTWVGFPQTYASALMIDAADDACPLDGAVEWTWPQGETGWTLSVDLSCADDGGLYSGAVFKATLTGNAPHG